MFSPDRYINKGVLEGGDRVKKRYIPLFVMLIFLFSTSANAQSERAASGYSKLTFSGTTARCDVEIATTNLKGNIVAVIELCEGDSCINSWEVSGTGFLYFSDSTTTVQKGHSYVLTVNYTIDGATQSPLTSSGTCK